MPATAPADGQTSGDTTENTGERLLGQGAEPKTVFQNKVQETTLLFGVI